MSKLHKRGKVWYLYWNEYDNKKRKRIKHGKRLSTDKSAALEYQHEFELTRYRKGLNLTIRDKSWNLFVKEYLEYSETNKSKRTVKIDRNALREFSKVINPGLLNEVTTHDLEKFKTDRLKIVTPVTLNIELRAIKAAFNKALDWNYIYTNPCNKVKKIDIPDKLPRYLSKEEIKKLLDATECRMKPVLETLLNTGMRISELLGLKRVDLNLERKELTVRKAKMNKTRVIPINDKLMKILGKVPKVDDYVFTNIGGSKLDATTLQEKFRKTVKKSGIKWCTLHSLRHTFSSHLVMNGVQILTVSKLLGHSDVKTTMIYAHLSQDHLHEAVNKLKI